VGYTPAEVVALTPVRDAVEKISTLPTRRDYFLCHAWDDRTTSAKQLHDGIEAAGASVWFSEKDIALGTSLMREIDRGLANSRVGLVLVTPQFLRRLPAQGVADKELSALLAGNRLVPVLHGTTYDELRDVSPLLASRTGLDTAENTMEEICAKLAELVAGLEPASHNSR
jgi:TIR domain